MSGAKTGLFVRVQIKSRRLFLFNQQRTKLYFIGMITKKHNVGKFTVLEICDDLTIISDLQDLDIFIDGLIKRGTLFIAVRFDKISYIYSGALAVLLLTARRLKALQGEICLLEPNLDIQDIMHVTNIDTILHIFPSEELLLSSQHT
ncbi:MAG: hypothetical protein A2293_13285 [Elusimicrobia bacterium RIFOXYB2_FULL_49_7]|nr:MAG: hypothetical protein A2293_13285 [Elusimicrobia bacterium RIFOXYB2_FULL_49_7]